MDQDFDVSALVGGMMFDVMVVSAIVDYLEHGSLYKFARLDRKAA